MEHSSRLYPLAEAVCAQPVDARSDLLAANIELFCHTSAIPFHNRLRFLVGDNTLSYSWTALDELAAKHGTEEYVMHSIVDELNVPDDMCALEAGMAYVSPSLSVVVSEECQWRQKYTQIKDEVTAPQMATLFGVTVDYIETIMKKSGVAPRVRGQGTMGAVYYYPKELLYRARAEIMMFPPAQEGRQTRAQIIGKIGCTHEWIKGRIDDADADPDLMREGSNAHVDVYYAKPFVERLETERATLRPQPDDGEKKWTKNEIAIALGRHMGWVDRELRVYTSQKIMQYGKNGRPYAHYGDGVFQELHALSEKIKHTPVIREGEVTLTQLVRPLGITETTAEPIIQAMGVVPAERRASTSERILRVYDVALQEALVNGLKEKREKNLKNLGLLITTLQSGGRAVYEGEVVDLTAVRAKLGPAKKKLNAANKIWQRYYEAKAA